VARAQLIITAVVVEGRSKSEVARDYGVSRYWVQQLVSRYQREGTIAFQPRSRRPHHSPQAVDADIEDVIVRLRKELSKQGLDAGAETIAAHLARQIPAGGGRPGVPAVSTIWRILSRRGFHQSATAETATVKLAHVLRRTAQRTLAGPTSPTGSWPMAPTWAF
jgi:transposase